VVDRPYGYLLDLCACALLTGSTGQDSWTSTSQISPSRPEATRPVQPGPVSRDNLYEVMAFEQQPTEATR
jgi:hypothetical protein